MATLELRPRTATEIIDASFQLLRNNYVPLVTLSVAAQLPVLAFRIIFLRFPMGANATPEEVMRALSSYGLLMFGLIILLVVAQNTVMVAASQIYLGEPMDAGASVRRSVGRFLWLVGSSILVLPIVMLAFLLFIIPGIYVGCRLIPLTTVVLLEDRGPWESIRRTWALGGGRVWHIFVASFFGGLIYFAIALVGTLLITALAMMLPVIKDPNVDAVFSTAIGALAYPMIVVVSVVLYYDLRIRHEGFDVEQMSKSLAT